MWSLLAAGVLYPHLDWRQDVVNLALASQAVCDFLYLLQVLHILGNVLLLK
jgi:hypothetical protein